MRPPPAVQTRWYVLDITSIYLAKYGVIHSIKINMRSSSTWPLTKLTFCLFKFLPNKDKFRIYLFVSKMKICISWCVLAHVPTHLNHYYWSECGLEREIQWPDRRTGSWQSWVFRREQRIVEMNWSTGIRTITSWTPKRVRKKSPMEESIKCAQG